MEDIEKLTEKLEQLFLDQLITLLESESIEVEKSKQITAEFLNLGPFSSFEEMNVKIKLFVDTYPAFLPFYKRMFAEPSQKTKELLDLIQKLNTEKSPLDALKSIGVAE